MRTQLHKEIFTPHLLIRALQDNADREVIFLPDGSSRTGREIADETSRYCQAFRAQGLNRASRIALLSGNRVEVIHVTDAALLEAMLITSLHPMGAVDDFAYVVEDANIDTIIFDPKFDHLVGELKQRCPQLKRVWSLGQSNSGENLLPFVSNHDAAPLIAPEVNGEDVYRLTYSGGTTGKPKGIEGSYRCFMTMTQIMMAEWEWPENTRQLLVSPLSHTGGTLFLPTLLAGGSMYVIPAFEPVKVMEMIQEHKINCMLMVPTMIYALMDHPRAPEFDLSSLETIIYGASPMSVPRLQEAIKKFGPIFFQFYGQSECPMTISVMRRSEHLVDDPKRLSSCGRPVPWIDVALLDHQGNPVPDGEPGEICTRGPLVMPGYYNKPDLTEEVFAHDWLHTGDIAIKDPDGFLRIVDRAKDMVITGGFNVFPREVEDVIATHPAVSAVSVFGTPDEKWGEAVTAAVALRPGMEDSAEDISKLVRATKGPHQTPKIIHFVDAIPVTNLGKPDKKALRKQFSG